MSSAFALPRRLIVFAIVLPLAAFIGFQMASPNFRSYAIVGVIFLVLCLPFFLRWHHAWLIFSWNLALSAFFLPGSPPLWMLVSVGSLTLAVVGRLLDKERRLIWVPSLSWPLILLAVVVLFTMKMTGTIGLRSFGSGSYGGKKYFFVLFAILGYFALSCQRTPAGKSDFYTGGFLLSGIAPMISGLIYMLGPSLWFLFYLFPVEWALGQAMEDFSATAGAVRIGRIGGLGMAGLVAFSFMLMKYGARGILDFRRPWRLVLLVAIIGVSMFGGFRTVVVTFAVLFALQFFLEGLHRTRLLPVVLLAVFCAGVALIPLAKHMPMSVQRCLSVLPLDLNPAARYDATGSTEWRLRMWKVLIPEIPKYFWIGKGYTASAADYYFAMESARRGVGDDFEASVIAGDYHNGLLSIILPFGIWGMLAFVAFSIVALRVLHANYRHGPAELRRINTFLYASFGCKLIIFFTVYGALPTDLSTFAGLVGLSISLNGGMCRASAPVKIPTSVPSTPATPLPRRWMPIRT